MGLLDELEQEAQKLRASADEAERRKAEREEVFRTQLEPGMTALHNYLLKLIASLKVLQPKKPLKYALNGYGEIVAYPEHEYEIKVNQQPGSREITFTYPALISNEECPTVEVQGASKVRTVAAAFQRFHLGGLLEPKKDASGEVVSAKFKAKGRIVQTAVFSADADSAVIKVTLTNFDALNTASKNFPASQFNDALFDDIGRYLTHEPNGLFREDLPDSYRNQLRTQGAAGTDQAPLGIQDQRAAADRHGQAQARSGHRGQVHQVGAGKTGGGRKARRDVMAWAAERAGQERPLNVPDDANPSWRAARAILRGSDFCSPNRDARDIRTCRRRVRAPKPPRDAECRSVRYRRTSRRDATRDRPGTRRCRDSASSA